MPFSKKAIRHCVAIEAKNNGFNDEIFCGLRGNDLRNAKEEKRQFVYIDHSYFRRGWANQHFRACRNWIHQTEIVSRKPDRLERFGIAVRPWRKTGLKIAVIPNTEWQQRLFDDNDWVKKTVKRLKEITDRPVEVRGKDHVVPFLQYLQDVWAVVTWGSVAGVEAALHGVPVFAEPTCPAHPVSAGPLEKIETPEYAENRHEWACSLTYASWHWSELDKIEWKDYWYSLRGTA